jgi:hypothetical protein
MLTSLDVVRRNPSVRMQTDETFWDGECAGARQTETPYDVSAVTFEARRLSRRTNQEVLTCKQDTL